MWGFRGTGLTCPHLLAADKETKGMRSMTNTFDFPLMPVSALYRHTSSRSSLTETASSARFRESQCISKNNLTAQSKVYRSLKQHVQHQPTKIKFCLNYYEDYTMLHTSLNRNGKLWLLCFAFYMLIIVRPEFDPFFFFFFTMKRVTQLFSGDTQRGETKGNIPLCLST